MIMASEYSPCIGCTRKNYAMRCFDGCKAAKEYEERKAQRKEAQRREREPVSVLIDSRLRQRRR